MLLDAEPRVIANSVARAAQTQQWRYAERDDELQRVYGITFPDKKEFAEW